MRERNEAGSNRTVGDCGECRYYQSTDGKSGRCRRYPPRVTVLTKQVVHKSGSDDYIMVARTEWPVVGPDDGCGEFEHALGKPLVSERQAGFGIKDTDQKPS